MMFPFGAGLRKRITFFFIVLASAPLLAVGWIASSLIEKAHGYDVALMESQLIGQKIEEIEKFFIDTAGILDLRVGYEENEELTLSDQEFILEGILKDNEAFQEVSFVSLGGQETSKRRRQGEEELGVLSEHSLILKAQEGEQAIGPVQNGLIHIVSPVRNRNGEIVQLLFAQVSLAQIIQSIEGASLGEEGYLILTDSEGNIISYGSGLETPGNFSQEERTRRVLQGAEFGALSHEDRYPSVFGGVPVVGAARRISDLGWGVFAEWPTQEADRIVRSIQERVLLVGGISILLVVLLAHIVSRQLTEPLKTLQAKALEIEKGNFDQKVEIRTGDELQDLGSAFNKMARGLVRLRELQNEFVFLAAHELRTPVTAIRWSIQFVLRDEKTSEKIRDALKPASDSTKRLVQLIEELLDIARSEAGRLSVSLQDCLLHQVVQEAIQEVKPLAQEQGIELLYEPDPSLRVLADPVRLREVFVNLLSNSIKYNKPGGNVHISHEFQDKAVVTHVKDTGIGISPKNQKHIFEKFFRAQSKNSQGIQGTGLGLFIVKELVERMNGTIWFQSQLGKGTTFSIALPRASS